MLRFACLQSCVPKDIYKAFAWINGGRPEGQQSGGAVQSCEREPWEHSAVLPRAEVLEPSTGRGSVPLSSHSLCSPACLRGGIRKLLLHFGAGYHLLSAVFSLFKVGTPLSAPVMIFVLLDSKLGHTAVPWCPGLRDNQIPWAQQIWVILQLLKHHHVLCAIVSTCYCGHLFKHCWEEKPVMMEVTTHHSALAAMVPHWRQICALWYLNTIHKPKVWASAQTHPHSVEASSRLT